jgi:Tfp pilus assembly protein PilX
MGGLGGVGVLRWVTDQLRRHRAESTPSFGQQLAADAALAPGERPNRKSALAAGERMELSAPW